VRGVPFAGAEWWWLDAEAHAVDLTLEVVDVAADVADAALADGRLDDVFAVTALGLQLLPGHDRLVAARLRAHAAAGNPAGLRREAEAYERVVAGEGVDPSPAILHLRAELARTLASRLPAATS
jgi:hypothetical protein